MMPAPPNVCPLRPVLFEELPEAPVPPGPGRELPDVSPGAPVEGAVPLVSEEEPSWSSRTNADEPIHSDRNCLPIPFPPLGPIPAALSRRRSQRQREAGRRSPTSAFLPGQTGLASSPPCRWWDRCISCAESGLVGVHQGVRIGRIGVEFSVVELDGADVLLAALHGLPLAVALDLLGDPGRGDGDGDGERWRAEK